MSSITLTNVNQFTEQPERQITKTYGGLDKMTVVLWGPYWLAESQRPAEGSPHPDYPLMFCVNSQIKYRDGAMAGINVNYAGRTDATGGSSFVSETLTTFNGSEKELSYTQPWSTLIQSENLTSTTSGGTGGTTPGGVTGTLQIYKAGIGNYVLRYLTKDVTYKYCCRPKPAGPIFGGGETVVEWSYSRFTGLSASTQVTDLQTYLAYLQNTGGPFGFVSALRPTSFQANQIIENWYEVQETWDFRYEIGR